MGPFRGLEEGFLFAGLGQALVSPSFQGLELLEQGLGLYPLGQEHIADVLFHGRVLRQREAFPLAEPLEIAVEVSIPHLPQPVGHALLHQLLQVLLCEPGHQVLDQRRPFTFHLLEVQALFHVQGLEEVFEPAAGSLLSFAQVPRVFPQGCCPLPVGFDPFVVVQQFRAEDLRLLFPDLLPDGLESGFGFFLLGRGLLVRLHIGLVQGGLVYPHQRRDGLFAGQGRVQRPGQGLFLQQVVRRPFDGVPPRKRPERGQWDRLERPLQPDQVHLSPIDQLLDRFPDVPLRLRVPVHVLNVNDGPPAGLARRECHIPHLPIGIGQGLDQGALFFLEPARQAFLQGLGQGGRQVCGRRG